LSRDASGRGNFAPRDGPHVAALAPTSNLWLLLRPDIGGRGAHPASHMWASLLPTADELPNGEIEWSHVATLFNNYDGNGLGFMDLYDLQMALDDMCGSGWSAAEQTMLLMKLCDRDDDGKLNPKEFEHVLVFLQKYCQQQLPKPQEPPVTVPDAETADVTAKEVESVNGDHPAAHPWDAIPEANGISMANRSQQTCSTLQGTVAARGIASASHTDGSSYGGEVTDRGSKKLYPLGRFGLRSGSKSRGAPKSSSTTPKASSQATPATTRLKVARRASLRMVRSSATGTTFAEDMASFRLTALQKEALKLGLDGAEDFNPFTLAHAIRTKKMLELQEKWERSPIRKAVSDVLDAPNSSLKARVVFLALMAAIITSVVNWHVSTLVSVTRSPSATSACKAVETVCTIVFLIELTARLFVATFDLYSMLLVDFTLWMDIASLLPYILGWIVGEDALPDVLKEGAALLKLLRVLKLMRHYADWRVLVIALRKAFRPLLVPMVAMFLSILLLAGALWIFERNSAFLESLDADEADGPHDDGFANAFETLWCVFWLVMTLGFDGYIGSGRTIGGRLIVATALLCGLILTTMPITIVGDAFVEAWAMKRATEVEAGLRKLLLERKLSAGDLGKIFDEFDSSGDRKLDFGEFKDVLRKLGITLEPAEMTKAFRHFDADESGTIDFEEFCFCIFGHSISTHKPGGLGTSDQDEVEDEANPPASKPPKNTPSAIPNALGALPDKLNALPDRLGAIEKSLSLMLASMDNMCEGQQSLLQDMQGPSARHVEDAQVIVRNTLQRVRQQACKTASSTCKLMQLSNGPSGPPGNEASPWPELSNVPARHEALISATASKWGAVQTDVYARAQQFGAVSDEEIEARLNHHFNSYLPTINLATVDITHLASKRDEFRAQATRELKEELIERQSELSVLHDVAEAAVSALAASMGMGGDKGNKKGGRDGEEGKEGKQEKKKGGNTGPTGGDESPRSSSREWAADERRWV